MTTSIDRQAGPNTDHNRADRQGSVRLEIAPEEPLLSDLECDIMNAKHSPVFYVSLHQALPAVGLYGLALAGDAHAVMPKVYANEGHQIR